MITRTLTVEITIEEETLEDALAELEQSGYGVEQGREYLKWVKWPRLHQVVKVVCAGKELETEETGFRGIDRHWYLPVNCDDETTLTVNYASG